MGLKIAKGKATDFEIELCEDRPVRILQFTDPQITDIDTTRTKIRYDQIKGCYFGDGIFDDDYRVYDLMNEVVERVKPDIITVTGDIVYGETDDSGALFTRFIAEMEKYKIPWIPVFGNHDNESAKGVRWQCAQFEQAEHCVFARGNVTGNCNFSVAVKGKDRVEALLMMLDTNGCHVFNNPGTLGEGMMADNPDIYIIEQREGIFPDQTEWYEQTVKNAKEFYGDGNLLSLAFFHIAPSKAMELYVERYGGVSSRLEKQGEGDFGAMDNFEDTVPIDTDHSFDDMARKVGTKGMFFGHEHENSFSLLDGNMRYTFGLKTGLHNSYRIDHVGGTLITADGKNAKVEHIYYDYKPYDFSKTKK